MSSFWENNKGSFKSAGLATAKGIGSGSKAIGKAGVNTYKKHEAKHKGLPPPVEERDGGGSVSEPVSEERRYVAPAPDPAQLQAYAPPPKRNVPTYEPMSGKYTSPPQVQPQTAPAQPQIAPLSSQTAPVQSQIAPAQSHAAPALPSRGTQETGYKRAAAALPPQPPQAQAQPVQMPSVQSPAPVPAPSVYNPNLTPTTLSKEDLSKFAPPPLHKDRGSASTTPTISQNTTGSTSHTTQPVYAQTTQPVYTQTASQPVYSQPAQSQPIYSQPAQIQPTPSAQPTYSQPEEPAAERPPVRYTELDLSKVGPPPPKYHGPALKSSAPRPEPSHQPSLASQQPVASNTFAPPPLRRTTNAEAPPPTPSRTGQAPPPLPSRTSTASSVPTLASQSSNTALNKPKKLPPTKPPKKPANLTETNPPPSYTESEGIPSTSDTPNFAQEIALRKVNRHSPVGKSESPQPNSEVSELDQVLHKAKPKPPKAKPKRFGADSETNEFTEQTVASLRDKLKKVDISHSNDDTAPAKTAPPPKPKPVIKPKPGLKPSSNAVGSKPINTSESVDAPWGGRNAPPPPPPRSHSVTPTIPPKSQPVSEANTPPPPPPSRNYQKKATNISEVSTQPPQLDLDLASGWYANMNGPLKLPKSLEGHNYTTAFKYSTRNSPVGSITSYTRTVNAQLKDLSRISYDFNWENDNFANVRVQITSFTPSPITHRVLNKAQLLGYHEQFSEYIASWVEHNMGQQVGRGECWDLAHDALLKGCGKHAFVSTYTHHGYPILQVQGTPQGVVYMSETHDEIRRGDILQFYNSKFENRASGTTQSAGAPDHTAVVLGNSGGAILVGEQNVGGVRTVRNGSYAVKDITGGTLVAYRAVPAAWAEA